MVLSPEILEFLKTKRFYVFFEDGSWRTCAEGQWKDEKLWKLKPVATGWFELKEFDIKVMEALIERFKDK